MTSSYDTVDEMNDNFRRIYKMTIKDSNKQKILNVIKELEDIDYVYAAEPNYFDKVLSVPNDYSSTSQYAVNMMDLDKAWSFTTGCSEITVGIIDTGVDGDHADLQYNINVELSRSFSADFTDPLDDLVGHGTHVAGIIGAVGNNGIGLTGVNWEVSIVSLRVANNSGNLPIGNVISAINYANEDEINIDILNYSGGGYNYSDLVISREQAIRNYSGLFVCAAGNDAKNTDEEPHYPSSHSISNLLSVGALNSSGSRDSYSNYGINTVTYMLQGEIYLAQ